MTNEEVEKKCLEFISRLKEIRKEKGISTYKLAELSGLKQGNISRVEQGLYFPNLKTIMKIALALKIDLLK